MSKSFNPSISEIQQLTLSIREFVDERDWEQFHSPKNLAMAISVEVAELVEIFQWMTELQSQNLNQKQKQAVEEEVADVMTYLIRLSDRLDIDLVRAVERKLVISRKKYPAELVRGRSQKYSEYKI